MQLVTQDRVCRWFPQGKVVFVAPTRPLVEQQRKSCLETLCIPEDRVEVMTGESGPAERKVLWERKTVIFCTPQVRTLRADRSICSYNTVNGCKLSRTNTKSQPLETTELQLAIRQHQNPTSRLSCQLDPVQSPL